MYASSKSLGWKLMRTSTKISYCVVPEQTALIACEIQIQFFINQGLHRLEKYLNIQDSLEKFLKNKFALKST